MIFDVKFKIGLQRIDIIVISIEHAVRIVHKSRITLDLEHKIDYLLVKVKDTLQERKDLLVDIEKQRNISMNSVKTFRKSLDNYINSLQANLELYRN
jgi:hypothetical protein